MDIDPVEDWFLGVDLGTGSCKTIVVDQNGRQIGYGASDYQWAGSGGASKFTEQQPESLVDSVIQSVRAALASCEELPDVCGGMSIGGALHSILAVDASGRPLSGVITWADNRAAALAESLRLDHGVVDLYKRTGCPVHGTFPLYKTLWLKEEQRDTFQRIAHLVSAKEYVVWRLSGELLVDYSIASGTGFLDTHDLTWNETALEVAGIKADMLSVPVDPLTVLPAIEPVIAAQMGIHPNTPLIMGSSDAVNSNLGTGAIYPWQATCNIGTSGALRVISPRPILDDRQRTWCYALDRNHWIVGGAINNGGLALDWLLSLFNGLPRGGSSSQQMKFEDLIALAESSPPGAGGVLCLPFLAGERSPDWNQDSRALFFGMNVNHSASHLARSLLEGIAFRLRTVQDILETTAGDICQVRASGGFTRSDLWLRIVSAVLNRQLCVPRVGSASALGAAFWALMAAGVIKEIDDIRRYVVMDRIFLPDIEEAALYNQMLSLYNDLYRSMSKFFPRIAYLQESLMD